MNPSDGIITLGSRFVFEAGSFVAANKLLFGSSGSNALIAVVNSNDNLIIEASSVRLSDTLVLSTANGIASVSTTKYTDSLLLNASNIHLSGIVTMNDALAFGRASSKASRITTVQSDDNLLLEAHAVIAAQKIVLGSLGSNALIGVLNDSDTLVLNADRVDVANALVIDKAGFNSRITPQADGDTLVLNANRVDVANALVIDKAGFNSRITPQADGDTLVLNANCVVAANILKFGSGSCSNASISVMGDVHELCLEASNVRIANTLVIAKNTQGSSIVADDLTIVSSNVTITGSVSLAGALLCDRQINNSRLSTIVSTDTLSLEAHDFSFGNIIHVSSDGINACISTTHHENTLLLQSSTTEVTGRFEVDGSARIKGGFDALSSVDGIVVVGSHGAEVAVAGLCVGDRTYSSNSFLWHARDGSLGSSTHWELVGGDLMVTRRRGDCGSSNRSVSYTLKIADDDAFEIHQSTSNDLQSSSSRRVARFGGVTRS